MRLQLILILLVFFQFSHVAHSQTKDKSDLKPTEIDFLFSYYKQDGDSSAVTGGQGTEELNDVASLIIVNIPVNHQKDLRLETGVSYYTSASSDQIDPSTISSASHHNLSIHANIATIKRDTSRNRERSVSFRINHQFNFISLGTGYSFTKFSKANNRSISLTGYFNYDKWAPYYKLSKLYPKEIRYFIEPLETDTRYTADLSLNINQVLNKKMQAGFTVGAIYQWGLLSTPFHRVYFADEELPDLERLPDRRIRIPLVGRFNYYVSDLIILRTFYRYYIDNFDIRSHTINIETPVKINNFFSIYPYYRYYRQTAAKYFASYKHHNPDEGYYTSDFDLSSFHSTMIGGGLRISPPLGINHKTYSSGKIKWLFRTIEFRYGHYWRSNGLQAHIFSINFGYIN